jgi:alkyl sulfatase BDS1-like metallo-beta-lactamase superfamily hydrolase
MAVEPKFTVALLRQASPSRFLDSMAVRLDGPAADGKHLRFNFVFDDVHETHVVELENSVLHHWQADPVPGANATVHLTRDLLARLGTGEAGIKDLAMSDDFRVEGSRLDLASFLAMVKAPDGQFPIVTP